MPGPQDLISSETSKLVANKSLTVKGLDILTL